MTRAFGRCAMICCLAVQCIACAAGAGSHDKTASTPEELFEYAALHLRSGKWIQRAVDQLEQACTKQPDNAKYREALASAYLCRALEEASWVWPRGKLDVPEAVRKRVALLARQAVKEAEQATRLAPQSPEYHYTLGWIYLVSYREFLIPRNKHHPHRTARLALAHLQRAVELAPSEARYLVGMADAMALAPEALTSAPDAGDAEAESAESGPSSEAVRSRGSGTGHSRAHHEDGTFLGPVPEEVSSTEDLRRSLYEKASVLKRRDAGVYFRLYQCYVEGAKADAHKAMSALERASGYAPDNALYAYMMAHLHYSLSIQPDLADDARFQHQQNAATFLARGNAAPNLSFRAYEIPFPEHMSGVLGRLAATRPEFSINQLPFFPKLRDIARRTTEYAQALRVRGEMAAAVDAYRQVFILGRRLVGDPRDLGFFGDAARRDKFVGLTIQEIALGRLERVFDETADEKGKAWIAAQRRLLDETKEALAQEVRSLGVTVASPDRSPNDGMAP